MAIDYEKLMALDIPEVEQSYTVRDTCLYGLGLGLGLDPMDTDQLRFVYEEGLHALPSMAVVLARPGFWFRDMDTGIDALAIVHGEQSTRFHAPLPTAGRVRGKTRVTEIVDKGAGRGALVITERDVTDCETGQLLATVEQTTFCRNDGGFGGPQTGKSRPEPLPERAPDLRISLPTSPQGALIYRLTGDLNPLHASPEVAAKAGFARPILHGLATYGIAGFAVLKGVCDQDPSRMRSLSARFTAPVTPGETLTTEIWRQDGAARFRVLSEESGRIVLSNGNAEIAP